MEDPLGIKPYGEAVHTVVKKTFEGIEAFLSATCKPALDELGMMLRDQVRVWRLKNALQIIEKSKGKFEFSEGEITLLANPKVALAIIENGSDEENDELQDLWAGLFVTSFSEGGKDDENLIYISILKQLTLPEVKLLKFVCEHSKKVMLENNINRAQTVSMYGDQIAEITGVTDYNKQEIILYHLSSLKLSDRWQGSNPSGFQSASFKNKPLAWISPTNLALNFYLRCIGIKQTASDYWKISPTINSKKPE